MNKTKVDLVIKKGQVVLPSSADPSEGGELIIAEVDIVVHAGKIIHIGNSKEYISQTEINARSLMVFPGVIDTQVHFREPGLTHKEDLASGTRAAIKGGVCTVLEMPNTHPPTTSKEAFNDKINRTKNRIFSNIGFFIGATQTNCEQLGLLENLPGCAGIKIFMGSSTGELFIEDDLTLQKALSSGSRRVAVHCEDNYILKERRKLILEDPNQRLAVNLHPVWRNEQSALSATQRLLNLAKKNQRPVHVLHVTTAEELELLQKNFEIATVECTPQHLTLFAPECYDRLGTLVQMNPPIRDERHFQALWRAVQNKVVTVIGSDHAPHTLDEKSQPYPQSPSGMPGVQTLLPLMLNHVFAHRLSVGRLVELVCDHPAKLFGIKNKGQIRVGFDADFTIVDLQTQRIIKNSWIESKCGWTPFDGYPVHGWPIYTVVGGHIGMQDDQIVDTPYGAMVAF